jgi:hypothetical protein
MNEKRIRQLIFEALEEAKLFEDDPERMIIPDDLIKAYRLIAILAGSIIGWPGMDAEQEQDRLQ